MALSLLGALAAAAPAGAGLGYDAIIGVEPDTYRPGGEVLSEVLIALNGGAITSPVLMT